MNGYLLDTNIMIYVVEERQNVLEFLDRLDQNYFFVSVVTRMECLVGPYFGQNERLRLYLDQCIHFPMDTQVADEAAHLHLSHKSLKFKDAVIAATAKIHKKTLVTSDKNFKKIKGIRVKLLKP